MTVLEHVLVPIASEEDARATAKALTPYLGDVRRVTAVHVVEKAGGAIDKAPMEKRREDATEFLAVVAAELDDRVAVDTRVEFATDVVDAILETADDVGATAVAFRRRGGSTITRLLSGNTADRLVTTATLPVVTLPEPTED